MYPNYNYFPQNQQSIRQQPPMQNQGILYLKGRPVSSIEEVKAIPIDFDGSIFIFPDIANKQIYTKQINLDGTASINVYELKILQQPTTQPQMTDGSYTLGVCVDDTKKIYINNKLSLEKIKKVLCHEITHAAMFSYNIQLAYDQEELLADLLSTYGQEIIDITNKIFSKIKNNRG